jgi:uncharacterized protein (DUF2147 family)
MNNMTSKIKRKIIASIASLLLFTGSILFLTSMKSSTDSIVGKWESVDKDYIWEFSKSGETYIAKILYNKEALESDGKTYKKDVNNTDPSLRSRSLQGIIFITELKYDDGEYVDGKIYSFRDGGFYDCKATVDGDNLHLRAYQGISAFGKTLELTRVK